MTATRGQPGPRTSTALAVLIAGAVVLIAAVVATVLSVRQDAHVVAAGVSPATLAVTLAAGQWEFIAPEPTDAMSQDKVIVTPVTGRSIVLVEPVGKGSARRTYDGVHYYGQLVFTTHAAGVYDIDVQTPETPFLIVPTYGSSLKRSGRWLALAGCGILGILAGLALFIVRASRLRRLAEVTVYGATLTTPRYDAADFSRPAPSRAPPPGWYPDPADGSTGRRWWDGARWTDHTQP